MFLTQNKFVQEALVFALFSIGVYFLISNFAVFSKAGSTQTNISGTIVLVDGVKQEDASATGELNPYLEGVTTQFSVPGVSSACKVTISGCCAPYITGSGAITRTIRSSSAGISVSQGCSINTPCCLTGSSSSVSPNQVHDLTLSCGGGAAARGIAAHLSVAYSCPQT